MDIAPGTLFCLFSREDFEMPELDINPLRKRIVDAFFSEG